MSKSKKPWVRISIKNVSEDGITINYTATWHGVEKARDANKHLSRRINFAVAELVGALRSEGLKRGDFTISFKKYIDGE